MAKSQAGSNTSANARARGRDIVRTPLGFYTVVLVLLVTTLGRLAGVTEQSRLLVVGAMLASVMILVAIVSVLAIWRPEALSGLRQVVQNERDQDRVTHKR